MAFEVEEKESTSLEIHPEAALKNIYALFTVVFLAALPGCGPSISSMCDDICECEGCSDDELDDCIDEGEDLEREVENEGCEDQFDDYLDCASEELECHDSRASFDGCGSELESLGNCLN